METAIWGFRRLGLRVYGFRVSGRLGSVWGLGFAKGHR